MLRFKNGVSIFGLQPEILWALDRANEIWDDDCTVTSGRGDRHGYASRHYLGMAADLRTRDISPQLAADYVAELKVILGKNFDVILEDNHIHIEYDPKSATDYLTTLWQ